MDALPAIIHVQIMQLNFRAIQKVFTDQALTRICAQNVECVLKHVLN